MSSLSRWREEAQNRHLDAQDRAMNFISHFNAFHAVLVEGAQIRR